MKEKNKSIKNMKLAFILNLSFAIFEIIGGLYTNSISIISDSVHDLGDSISIGIGLFLKKISLKKPDEKYTYGYGRFSVVGALINLIILSVGSTLIIITALPRLFNTEIVNSSGMLVFAILGILVNLIGTLKTHNSKDISEKVISLHLLEDLLGWILVLITSLVISVWEIYILDPILSLILALFIIVNVFKNFKVVLNIILEKTPSDINTELIKNEISKIKNVLDVHHIHMWSIDGNSTCFTSHIKINKNLSDKEIESIKHEIKHLLLDLNISHTTLEFETTTCHHENCDNEVHINTHHMHHH